MACFKNYSGYSIATNRYTTIAIFEDGRVWVTDGGGPIYHATFRDYIDRLGQFDRLIFPELTKTVEFAAAVDVWGLAAAIEFFEKPKSADEVINELEKIAKALHVNRKCYGSIEIEKSDPE